MKIESAKGCRYVTAGQNKKLARGYFSVGSVPGKIINNHDIF